MIDLSQPINTWPIRPLICVPVERTLPLPDKVLPPLFHMAQCGANFLWMPYTMTHLARNKAVNGFLSHPEFDALLFLDCDHVHDPEIVHLLVRDMLLHPEIKVVGGLNFQRRPPHKPCFYTEDEDGSEKIPLSWPDELFPVDVLGTGSMLIHRSVFTQIEPPWFWFDNSHYWEDYFPGEDVWFSHLCKKAGIQMWVDPEVRSPHINEQLIDENAWRKYFAEHGIEDEQGNIR